MRGRVIVAIVCACARTPDEPVTPAPDAAASCIGTWRAGPALLDRREYSPLFALDNDRVLVVGGHFKGKGIPVDSTEILDLRSNTSMLAASFSTTRTVVGSGGTVMLPDRRVFSASPFWFSTNPAVASELYDPVANKWTVAGTMAFGGGPALALRSGAVIVAGGIDWNSDTPIARTEQWDRGTWTTIAPMTTPRTGHALLLVNDRPMAIGGFAKYPDGPGVGTSEIFIDGKWGSVANMADKRAAPAVILNDGRVLAAGGTSESGGYKPELATAELYDPKTNTWRATGSMSETRTRFSLTVLKDGRVLATGGGNDAAVTSSAEIYDPATGTWTRVAPMASGRGGHTTILLSDGDVLVVGGDPATYTSEIFHPCARQ
jgi:hypothetical protein